MAKSLIIAEKPSLGRTIAAAIPGEHFTKKEGYLEGDHYLVSWCFGHMYELIDLDAYYPGYDPAHKPKWTLERLPFYPNDWQFKYTLNERSNPKTGKADDGYRKQVKTLSTLMNRSDVDTIYGAGDADNEGQAIVDNLLQFNLESNKKVLRLWLPELTPESIQEQLRNAKDNSEYLNVYNAALARSGVDWLIGIELTRFASIKGGGPLLRLGRCICPIVSQVVERENAIKNFVPKPYSAVVSKEKTNGEEIELTSKHTFDEGHEAEAQALADRYNKAGAVVTGVKTERKEVKSPKLFSLSDLQSYVCDVDKSLTPADVLAATQALYEAAVVTYPRTNSSYLATGEFAKVEATIRGLGLSGLTSKAGNKAIYDNSKIESHSALIPTGKTPDALSGAQKTVYEAILNRFCAVFCAEPCTVDRTTITIQCSDETFTLKGDVQVTPGWRKYEKPDKGDKILPRLNKGDAVNINFKPVGKKTTPPKRYTVKTLNNWMITPMRAEDKPADDYTDEEWKDILSDATICTEATRADTLNRCMANKYISLKKGVYYAEEAGFYLVDVMNSLGIDLGPRKTVDLSRELHRVKEGVKTREDVYEETKVMLDGIILNNRAISSTHSSNAAGGRPVVGKCPKCGSDIVETPKGFGCVGKTPDGKYCSVSFWKNSKFLDSIGKKMTKSTVVSLLKDGKAPLKGCVSKKTGKTFDCVLRCDFMGERPEFRLDFDSPAGTPVGKCPFCGADVYEKAKLFSCSNHDCEAALWKTTKVYGNEVEISTANAKKLLSGKSIKVEIPKRDKSGNEAIEVSASTYTATNGRKYISLSQVKKK